MKIVKLYQTLEDRCNPDEIENHGPFVCRRSDAWLGEGAYFWEDDLEQAYEWGNRYQNGFVICESEYDSDNKNYLDLTTNKHYKSMKKCQAMLEEKNKGGKVFLSDIINFMKDDKRFTYKAIRFVFIKKDDDPIVVSEKYGAFLYPPVESIQICVIKNGFLRGDKYEIIYPPEYVV